ncbi:hypothetical protein ACFV3R_34280 [Streptomyces sp. NPDC059740]|uniref:hypothetical protein n=1 Tax=Streptomyces sp. NPDC059740 TaxID=3346926 RepID=UPI00365DE46D
MELRDRLERHAALADMYCRADERVVEAHCRLEELQGDRLKVLAALAVTIGSDAGAAHYLGLHEREVRAARKAVGRVDAEEAASTALDAVMREDPGDWQPPPVPTVPPVPPAPSVPPAPPVPGGGHLGGTFGAGVAGHGGTGQSATVTVPTPERAGAAPAFHGWSHAMDDALLKGWHQGVDPQDLSAHLGCSLRDLVVRLQQLSVQHLESTAQGADRPASAEEGGNRWESVPTPSREQGRHRRHRKNHTADGLSAEEALMAVRELVGHLEDRQADAEANSWEAARRPAAWNTDEAWGAVDGWPATATSADVPWGMTDHSAGYDVPQQRFAQM